LRWVESEIGARVLAGRALDGGTSSAVHLLSMEDSSGRPFQTVLRRYVLDWVAEEPWAPGNEATVLRLLANSPGIPAPRLLAADLDGSVTGTPCTVMSALRGEVVWAPAEMEPWLRRLAELLPVIHSAPIANAPDLGDWAPYAPEPGLIPPPWTQHKSAWERALESFDGARPASERVFLHRDFHPGNILWTGADITGVVDWVSSCAGPPEEDVSHCRVNIAQHHGLAQADRFLALWQDVTGRRQYHPYWDLATLVSMVTPEPDAALDEFVAAAVARLR
jgi:aminoglycoside phosphotransferase (APT) family kinase protein